MLKRKMYDQLLDWKRERSQKAFLLVGARQTGKTYIVRKFGQAEYSNVIEVNFLEDKQAATLLSGAMDVQDLLSRLTLLSGKEVHTGKTLVFLDEVQEAPEIVTFSKFLVEDGRFDVVLSGSMLGTALKGTRSFPVGYARIERMFPLSFEEFCWSQGVSDDILNQIRESYSLHRPLDTSLHDRLVQLYRYFIAIGGMPEAVQKYIDTSYDMGAVRMILRDLVEQYQYDIVKYAKRRKPYIKSVFDTIPSQLDKENKRFMLKSLAPKATFDRYEDDFLWLIDAAVALPAYCVAEPKRPLLRTREVRRFKLYSSDTGLLLAQYPQRMVIDVLNGARSVNYGAVYENAVAQELSTTAQELYYYRNNRKGEVDFLLETKKGEVLPIEVKSGKDYKLHVALNNLLQTKEYSINRAVVLSEANVSQVERPGGKHILYLPLYMTFCLAEEIQDDLSDLIIPPPTF